jgi:hypothetical protein
VKKEKNSERKSKITAKVKSSMRLGYLNLLRLLIYKDFYAPPLFPIWGDFADGEQEYTSGITITTTTNKSGKSKRKTQNFCSRQKSFNYRKADDTAKSTFIADTTQKKLIGPNQRLQDEEIFWKR